MQDINNKLTDFFKNFVDELAEVKTNETTALYYLQAIEQKQDNIIDLLRIIAANTKK